jgi:hypothetical protein
MGGVCICVLCGVEWRGRVQGGLWVVMCVGSMLFVLRINISFSLFIELSFTECPVEYILLSSIITITITINIIIILTCNFPRFPISLRKYGKFIHKLKIILIYLFKDHTSAILIFPAVVLFLNRL